VVNETTQIFRNGCLSRALSTYDITFFATLNTRNFLHIIKISIIVLGLCFQFPFGYLLGQIFRRNAEVLILYVFVIEQYIFVVGLRYGAQAQIYSNLFTISLDRVEFYVLPLHQRSKTGRLNGRFVDKRFGCTRVPWADKPESFS
jgi:hypothetical protein